MERMPYWYYAKGNAINILFLIHPIILKATIEMFACTSIEGTDWLDVYMEDECCNAQTVFSIF